MRPNNGNPNMVHVDEGLEKRIYALTHQLPNHQLDPSDVFLVGYMKSGTSWLRNLVAGVVYGLTSEYMPYSVVWELIPSHGQGKPFYKRYSTPMYFKVHDFPRPQYKRVVFLVRDGRDVVVSLAHHLKAVYKHDVALANSSRARRHASVKSTHGTSTRKHGCRIPTKRR